MILKMGRKKCDIKIRSLIEKCVSSNRRALFLHIGPKVKDEVVIMHHILQKTRISCGRDKPSVLWCFKKDKFSFIVKKVQKTLKKKYSRNYSLIAEDCYDHFLASADITFCHYNDTISILGQTFGMLVVQDFEAVTPNIMARIIECVEGAGIISIMFSDIQTFEEIKSLKMDAHSKYVTSAHSKVHPLFNYRFLLSLSDCTNCMILDDDLQVCLPPSNLDVVPFQKKVRENIVINYLRDDLSILNKICNLCSTKDQTDALLIFIEQLTQKSANGVVSLTSARGRGKSAALGLAISAALFLKYSNIYVTSPQIDNLQTLFYFVVKGMKTLDFKEEKDYHIIFDSLENSNLICGINFFHYHKQAVRYLCPTEFSKVEIANLVVIDEAAAIPLPVIKNWLNSNIVFMASTINGYEGTGRSLSLKLLNQLRQQSVTNVIPGNHHIFNNRKDFMLHEVTLTEAIRYADGDGIESWLNSLFCLDSGISTFGERFVTPDSCELYYVNKEVLFSYQNVAEKFLQQLVALFVSSHYKNCPNDLLMMADAPSHHLFCLLAPSESSTKVLPDILCVIQVAMEGKISKDSITKELSQGKRASGDLIPWIISQQFQDNDFPLLSGARIVRIATHPNFQRMGYGQQALKLLFSHYQENSKTLNLNAGKSKSTLLFKLHELKPEKLDYIGVSYGLTLELLKFWKKLDFVPLYLRQTASEITGEHSCIMIRSFAGSSEFLPDYASDFLDRFVELLSSAFNTLPAHVALEILHQKKSNIQERNEHFFSVNINKILSVRSIKRLEAYCNHMVDYHLIMDLMPILSRNYFLHHFKDFFLSSIQEAILLCLGLQNKAVEKIAEELNMETSQVMGLFWKVVKKFLHKLLTPDINITEKNSHLENQKKKKLISCHQENMSLKSKNETYLDESRKRPKKSHFI